MNNITFGGTDTRPGPTQGQAFAYYETAGGGMGAGRGSAAWMACTRICPTLEHAE